MIQYVMYVIIENYQWIILFEPNTEEENVKIQLKEGNIVKGSIQQENQFSIKASSHAFEILSSGLYSDKILAIVRELSANALDSHIAANTPDVPIEIKLPSLLDSTFYVKDFGVGLTHEQIVGSWTINSNGEKVYVGGLYNTYFESTKQDSNDFIGALGLGSKSPFCYTDNFMVESRQHGISRIYSCFKDEYGLPAVTLLSENDTTEPNGLTVTLTTKAADENKFKQAAKIALRHYDTPPNIIGCSNFEIPKIKYIMSGSNWKIRSDDSANVKGLHIVQGVISYPIDANILEQQNISNITKQLIRVNMDIYVTIGEVEVAASRESLSYDPRTISNLVKLIENIAKELCEIVQQQFDQCTTKWQVGELYNNLNTSTHTLSNWYNKITLTNTFYWQNEPVDNFIYFDQNKIKDIDSFMFKRNSRNRPLTLIWKLSDTFPQCKLSVRNNVVVIVDHFCRSRQYYAELAESIPHQYILVIRPRSKHKIEPSEFDYILNSIGNPDFLVTEKLTPKKSIRKSSSLNKLNQPVTDLYIWNGSAYNNSPTKHNWSIMPHTISEGGFYVPMSKFAVVNDGVEFNAFAAIYKMAKYYNIIASTDRVYGIHVKHMKNIQQNPKWINVIDYIKGKVAEPKMIKQWSDILIKELMFEKSYSGNNIIYTLVQHKHTNSKYLGNGELKQFVDSITFVAQSNQSINYTLKQLGLTDVLDKINIIQKDITTRFDSISQKYNMLNYITYTNARTSTLDFWEHISNYINLVDNSLTIKV